MGSIFFEKNTFPIVFQNLGGNFSGFWVIIFQHGSRNCIGFQAFQSDLCQFFFGLHGKFYWLVCRNCTLCVDKIVFMGSIFFEKNTFPFVFHILGGNFSGFWVNLFQHGSRNCIGFQAFQSDLCQFFSDFTENFIGWSVRTALYVSTWLFSWEVWSLKKKFQNFFPFLDGDFSGFRRQICSTVV